MFPGAIDTPPAVTRKRPQSVQGDGSLWVREAPETRSAAESHGLPHLAQMVLPKPAVAGNRWNLLTNVLGDFLIVFANFVLASELHVGLHGSFVWITRSPQMPPCCVGFVLLYGSLITLLAYSEGLYRTDLHCNSEAEHFAVLRTVGWATVLAGTLIHLFGIKVVLPFTSVAACGLLNFFSLLAKRNWQGKRAAVRARNGQTQRNVLIVGAGRLGHRVAEYLQGNARTGRTVRGFLDDNWSLDSEVLGTVDDLARVARAEFADEVILAAPREAAMTRKVIAEARRIHLDVKLVPDLFGFEPRSVIPETFGELPVISLYEEAVPAAGFFLKRAFDVVSSSLALLLLAPALAVIALFIRLESAGPVLYRAPRVGRKGRCFLCYKFRTMRSDADAMKERLRSQNQREGPFFKIAGDPRITRVGHVLRRYSLDELPQLWNVLKGEMSMVGPRPHPLDDFARYELDHLKRLVVTPGITGLWQVTARQDPSFARNLALDQQYIEHWSLWMDLRILFKTALAVWRGSGA